MSKKEYISLPFNEVSWRVALLGENTYLLIAPEGIAIEKIHHSTLLIKHILGKDLIDIVPAYNSIALFSKKTLSEVILVLSNTKSTEMAHSIKKVKINIPICYELGLDLEEVSKHSGLSVDRVIDLHLQGEYKSLFIGFTPGFVYADGLDNQLECPRRKNPRKRLEAGSIGIGGGQTGIYSLDSPGGWNILGRTPLTLFDFKRDQPMLIEVGTTFHFHRITKEEFEAWEN